MGYDEGYERYVKAHAEHRATHGPHGSWEATCDRCGGPGRERGNMRLNLCPSCEDKLADLGASVLEILHEERDDRYCVAGRPLQIMWDAIDTAARSLGLLSRDAEEGGS